MYQRSHLAQDLSSLEVVSKWTTVCRFQVQELGVQRELLFRSASPHPSTEAVVTEVQVLPLAEVVYHLHDYFCRGPCRILQLKKPKARMA